MASSSSDAVARTDGHRDNEIPRTEDATAGDATSILPLEPMPKLNQGIYTAIFRRRFHITVPGLCNAGGKKSLLINTFAIEPMVWGWRNDRPVKNNVWPCYDSFPYLLLDSFNIRLSKFVPLMRTTHIGVTTNDNVTFESSPYCMIANIGKGQQTDIEVDARTERDMKLELVKFGSVYSRFDRFHEVCDVELLGMQGEYNYYRKLNNAPMRYYFHNYKEDHGSLNIEVDRFYRFPIDSEKNFLYRRCTQRLAPSYNRSAMAGTYYARSRSTCRKYKQDQYLRINYDGDRTQGVLFYGSTIQRNWI